MTKIVIKIACGSFLLLATLSSSAFAGTIAPSCAGLFNSLSPNPQEWRARTSNETLDWFEQISQQYVGKTPDWTEDFANNPKEMEKFKKSFKALKNRRGPYAQNVRAMVAQLYRFSLIDLAKRVLHDPQSAVEILARVPDEVLALRVERGLMTKGATDVLRDAGILRTPSLLKSFSEYMNDHENAASVVTTALFSILPLKFGGDYLPLMPHLTYVSDRYLAATYGPRIQREGLRSVMRSIRLDQGDKIREEILINTVGTQVNTVTMAIIVGFAAGFLWDNTDKLIKMHQFSEKLKSLSKALDSIRPLGTADQEGDELLVKYEKERNAEGRPLTPSERKQKQEIFRSAYAESMQELHFQPDPPEPAAGTVTPKPAR